MPTLIRKSLLRLSLLLSGIMLVNIANASHHVGGKITYSYLGMSGSNEKYEITLTLDVDCQNGQPEAILTDDPAYLAVYDRATNKLVEGDTAVHYSSFIRLSPDVINPCIDWSGKVCILERQFKRTFLLPPSPNGYLVSYQRCCFPAAIVNISNPGDNGTTFYCVIPSAFRNTSPVFKHNAQVVICVNDALAMDLSATDADGDSLTYELTNILRGASPAIIKPFPAPGPYDSIPYLLPASKLNPLRATGGMFLNPVTGILSGIPDRIGIYAVAVNCIEWRGGVAINKVYQQFQVVAANCSDIRNVVGKDTAVIKGASLQFHAKGGTKYRWLTNYNISNDSISNPTASFPDLGTFTYVVIVSSTQGCTTVDTIRVRVVEHSDVAMPNAFSPNGDGLNDIFKPEFIGSSTIKYFRIYNRFGNLVYDGTEGWDGRYKGRMQDMQVFSWTLLYENNLGEAKQLKGNVTLVR